MSKQSEQMMSIVTSRKRMIACTRIHFNTFHFQQ